MTISFDNMLEMGVKVIFAKDGTDAMDPALSDRGGKVSHG